MIKDRDHLFELPLGWEVARLGDIAEVIMGQSPPGDSYNQEGIGTPLINGPVEFGPNPLSKTIRSKFTTQITRKCQKDDLILCVRGSTTGRMNIAGFNACIGRGVAAIRSFIYQDYLNYFIYSARYQIYKLGTGSTFPNVSSETLNGLIVPIPPLAEQKRIVAKIEELFTQLDAGVELLKKLKKKLKRYRQAVLKAAVEGKLTQEWREAHRDTLEPANVLRDRILKERREKWEADQLAQMQAKGKLPKDDSWKKKYKEPVLPNIADLPELPESWCWVTVEQMSEVGTGGTPLRTNKSYYEFGTIPWVTSGALNDLFITQAEEMITDLAIQETNAKVFPVHTLLIAMYGEGKTRGKVSELMIEAATNQACAALVFRDLSLKIQPYIKLFLQKNYDDIRRLSSGGVQPNLNLSIVKATVVPLPSLPEQQQINSEIERLFSVIDSIEKVISNNLKRSEKFRQSILRQAFEGKLVPQNPDDEPASVLCDRIKAEKAKREVEMKAKRKNTVKSRKSDAFSQQLEMFQGSAEEPES